MAESSDQFIKIGDPLDLLLNRDLKLKDYDPETSIIGGILLPTKNSAGTGNIVIKGRPGTGKSTLALQTAVACTKNGCSAAYISLEERVGDVCKKSESFGWRDDLQEVVHLHDSGEFTGPEELGFFLAKILTQPDNCPLVKPGKSENTGVNEATCDHDHHKNSKPRVLLPLLSPRSVLPADIASDKLFWERYHQLENLLAGAQYLRDHREDKGVDQNWKDIPELRLVCIDSLNVFGDRLLEREELFRLFDLFKRYQTIGVFIVETSDLNKNDSSPNFHLDTIEFMSDTVITLFSEEENSYFRRYLEIEKSRYTPQVYGKHPFKIKSMKFDQQNIKTNSDDNKKFQQAFEIFPSLHYLMSESENQKSEFKGDSFYLGAKNFDHILPRHLKRYCVVTIEGPKATFKRTIAKNFLIEGVVKENESSLLICFRDSPSFDNKDCILSNDDEWRDIELTSILEETVLPDFKLSESSNVETKRWKCTTNNAQLIELAFKGGAALLAEEFMWIINKVFKLFNQDKYRRISRVVLDDISLIGVSYPFLHRGKTTGDLFLTIFIQLIKSNQADLVIVGTTGELAQANEEVNRACSLSDTVLSCRTCDIFGERLVTITGEGLLKGVEKEKEIEPVPGVIRIRKEKSTSSNKFSIDLEYLRGLVGFDTNQIHRPGLSLYLMQATGVHEVYNDEVIKLFGSSDVQVIPFVTQIAEPMYGSLKVLQDTPIDRTVVCMIDEFWYGDEYKEKRKDKDEERYKTPLIEFDAKQIVKKCLIPLREDKLLGRPYYSDVLILAYCKEIAGYLEFDEKDQELKTPPYYRLISWRKIWNAVQKYQKISLNNDKLPINFPFNYIEPSYETMSCILMDALISNYGEEYKNSPEAPCLTDLASNEDLFKVESDRGEKIKKILWTLNEKCLEELNTLQKLLMLAPRGEKESLRPDAALYLCWYSQLRELIGEHPALADQLDICALPGGGVSDNWFLGIKKGSVSIELGREVIETLCTQPEEFKRFYYGIGLPTSKSFYIEDEAKGFQAWPGATISLNKILQIQHQSISRSCIPQYKQIRYILAMVYKQLVPLTKEPKKLEEIEDLNETINNRSTTTIAWLLNLFEIAQQWESKEPKIF